MAQPAGRRNVAAVRYGTGRGPRRFEAGPGAAIESVIAKKKRDSKIGRRVAQDLPARQARVARVWRSAEKNWATSTRHDCGSPFHFGASLPASRVFFSPYKCFPLGYLI